MDSIYRSTNFDGYSGTGFEIQEIRIHETDTPVSDGQTHYNMKTDNWGTKELLQVSHTIEFFVNNLQLMLYPDSGISMDEEIVLGDMIWSYNKAEL